MRLQSQPGFVSNGQLGLSYTGPLDCFRKSLASGGVGSLYRGVSAPVFGAAVETSSLFFSYRVAQEIICAVAYPSETSKRKPDLPFSSLLVCGAASGAFTSVLLTPIELVKCQMQAGISGNSNTAFKSPISVIASIWRHDGLSGFWRGQLGTLIRETGGSAAWFGSYEGVGALLKQRYPVTANETLGSPSAPVWHQLVAGACAGISYNFLFYPADTIKSRMQTEQIDIGTGSHARTEIRMNFWSTGRKLWAEQGISGMYRGCGITVARAAPSSAIVFAIFERLRTTFA